MKSFYISAVLLLARLMSFAIDLPAGTELSAFISGSSPTDNNGYVDITLEPGATYELTDTAESKLYDLILIGDENNPPIVKVSGNGCLVIQNGLKLRNINFDMTEAKSSSFILMNSNPDPSLSTEALGLKELGATLDGYVDMNAIVLNSCNFRNMPGSIISCNGAPWALGRLAVDNCIVQFNKKNAETAIDFGSNTQGYGIVKSLEISRSTFYNTSKITDCDFISYGTKCTDIYMVFGNSYSFQKNFKIDQNTFSNLFPDGKFFSYTMTDNFDYDWRGNVLYNCGTIETYTNYIMAAANNVVWNSGKELTLTSQQQRFLTVNNPELTGPIDREFNLNEPDGGVNFRPRSPYCEKRTIGDPRWYPQPITIPAGTDLSKFIPENILDGSQAKYRFNLESGATYAITDSVDCKLASVTLGISQENTYTNRPTVKISDNGCFVVQNGLEIEYVNFDMTDASAATGSSFIKLAYEPDSCLSTKYNGQKEMCGEKIMDGFMTGSIGIYSCDFKNIPGSIITNNHAPWAVSYFSINNCVMQFNKQNDDAAINFNTYKGTDWANFSQILHLYLNNSTFYNTSGDVKARFIWYLNKKSAQPENAFGEGAVSTHSFRNCTFSQTFTGNQFANNMPETDKFTVQFENNIFYDIQRVDQYCCRSNQQLEASNNISWLAGTEAELSPNVEKFSTIADPDFVGPINLPYDLSDEFGGVNFRPMNPICKEGNIGDPRWFNAMARAIVIPEDREISSFVAENVPDGTMDEMYFSLLPGTNYQLTGKADIKDANVTFIGDKDSQPIVKISDEGTFVAQNGLKIKNIDFDMTDAPVTSLITLNPQPSSAFYIATISDADCYVSPGEISLNSCNIRNLPGSIISQGDACWAVTDFLIDDCVVQFDKKNTQPAIDFDDRWEFGAIKDMTLRNSTFYNTGEITKCYFIRYGMRQNGRITKAFGEWSHSTHIIDGCTLFKTFSDKHFANNMPEDKTMTVEINSSIFYDISRLDNYFSRSGRINYFSDNNNMSWLAGNDEGNPQTMRPEVEEFSYVENPDFVGPCDLPYELNEELGGVSFRPQNQTAIDNKIGDPRWLDDPSSINEVRTDTDIITDGPVEYYNLQGICVSADRLIPGIYIKRQGNNTTKVYVK